MQRVKLCSNEILQFLTGGAGWCRLTCIHKHAHTHLMALCPGLPGSAGTRKVKPIWILLKQETMSGGGISWAVCKSASRSRQITRPAPHHSVFYRPDALPAAQPTASKHWRLTCIMAVKRWLLQFNSVVIIVVNVYFWCRWQRSATVDDGGCVRCLEIQVGVYADTAMCFVWAWKLLLYFCYLFLVIFVFWYSPIFSELTETKLGSSRSSVKVSWWGTIRDSWRLGRFLWAECCEFWDSFKGMYGGRICGLWLPCLHYWFSALD